MTLTMYAREHIKQGLHNVAITAEDAAQLVKYFPVSVGGVLKAAEGNTRFELYECRGGWRLTVN